MRVATRPTDHHTTAGTTSPLDHRYSPPSVSRTIRSPVQIVISLPDQITAKDRNQSHGRSSDHLYRPQSDSRNSRPPLQIVISLTDHHTIAIDCYRSQAVADHRDRAPSVPWNTRPPLHLTISLMVHLTTTWSRNRRGAEEQRRTEDQQVGIVQFRGLEEQMSTTENKEQTRNRRGTDTEQTKSRLGQKQTRNGRGAEEQRSELRNKGELRTSK